MRIKLPLNKEKSYVFVPYKDNNIIIFEEKKFERFCDFLIKQKDLPNHINRILYMSSHHIEYNLGWNIPKKLLDYISYNGNIEMISSNNTPKYSSYIIRSPK